MQIRSKDFSRLRQKLIQLCETRPADLAPFLGDGPMMKGTVYVLRRKCSKPSCRCARGLRHESLVLSASVEGRTRLWTIPEDRVEEIRGKAERYRQFRQARTQLIRREQEILRVLDALEKARTQEP